MFWLYYEPMGRYRQENLKKGIFLKEFYRLTVLALHDAVSKHFDFMALLGLKITINIEPHPKKVSISDIYISSPNNQKLAH